VADDTTGSLVLIVVFIAVVTYHLSFIFKFDSDLCSVTYTVPQSTVTHMACTKLSLTDRFRCKSSWIIISFHIPTRLQDGLLTYAAGCLELSSAV
jgi:hypothetical protein